MSNTYWQDRAAKAQAIISGKTQKQIDKQLRKYYRRAFDRVVADFEHTYLKVLDTIEDGREVTPADLYKLDSYWKMQGQLKQELQKLGNREIAALSKAFETNFFEVYYSLKVEGAKEYSTIDTETVQQLINNIWVADGKSWSQRIWDKTDKLIETLNDELINCVATGKKTSDLKKALQERFNVSYHNADMIARTELAHIQTQAAQQRYKDYGIQKLQVWADEDERRCEVCGKLHEKIFLATEQPPIPAHPRCRCCILPVVE